MRSLLTLFFYLIDIFQTNSKNIVSKEKQKIIFIIFFHIIVFFHIHIRIKMNILYFKESLEFISFCGNSLTHEKAILIENSLIVLQSENKFQDIFFWGCINATEHDYYIAFGYRNDCLSGRRFFYSINCYKWYLLPPCNPENIVLCLRSEKNLSGDVSFMEDIQMVYIFVFKTS